MATWQAFAEAEPEMAVVLHKQLDWIPICYLATTRRDGSPRVHPFCPIFAAGQMFIAVAPSSPKRWELARDGRYAVHALPGKLDAEFYMTGAPRASTTMRKRGRRSSREPGTRPTPSIGCSSWAPST